MTLIIRTSFILLFLSSTTLYGQTREEQLERVLVSVVPREYSPICDLCETPLESDRNDSKYFAVPGSYPPIDIPHEKSPFSEDPTY